MADHNDRLRTAICHALVGLLSLTGAGLASDLPKTYTNDATFFVPFSVEDEADHSQAHAVQLFVSGDHGAHWEPYQIKKPAAGRFLFRAGVDGEFWFAVRTLSANGSSDKSQVHQPELIVVVDQVPPQIQLAANAVDGQAVTVEWTVGDTNLAETGLVLEYKSPAAESWLQVPAAESPVTDGSHESQGSTSWNVAGDSPAVQIRATVTDRAGNTTVVERQLLVASISPTAVGSPPPTEMPGPKSPALPMAPSTQLFAQPKLPGAPPAMAVSPPSRGLNEPESRWRLSSQPPVAPVPHGPVGSSGPAAARPQQTYDSTTPPAAVERTSRSQRFQLEYEIEGQDSLRIHRVEVWATNDQGQTWRHLGDDGDKRSPFTVTVPDDGVYGFRLLVQAREGLPVRPPMNGEEPDAWVRVDSTAPVVHIASARFGRGPSLGQLEISWDTTDQDLTVAPVTLLFGESSDGPWRIVADNLPNTGFYNWTVDDRVPREMYLRLEVQDRSGNIGSHTLSEPIRAEGLLPKGKIRNVRPASLFQPAERSPATVLPAP